EKLHEKAPSKRYQSATEVAELLERCLAHVQQPTSTPLPAVLSAPATVKHPMAARHKVRLALAGCIGLVLAGIGLFSAGPRQENDQPSILKLIEQLGSDQFAERDKAMKALDQIGDPALEALRKAAQSDDLERKRRAEELVTKIEGRDLAARVL